MQLISMILAFLATLAVVYYLYNAIVVAVEARSLSRHPIILGLIWPVIIVFPFINGAYKFICNHLNNFFFGGYGDDTH